MKNLWWYHKSGYPEDFSFAVARHVNELVEIVSRTRKENLTLEQFESNFEYEPITMVGRYTIRCEYTD